MKTRKQLYTGYWFEILEQGNTNFLSEAHEGTELSAYDFLHGFCTVFAYALALAYGYDILVIYNYEFNLIHAYCVYEHKGERFFIDVRGITTDEQAFFKEFEMEFFFEMSDYADGNCDFFRYRKSDSREYLRRFLNWNDKQVLLKEAERFIRANPEQYAIHQEEFDWSLAVAGQEKF